MNKKEIIKYINKNLADDKNYTYLVIDMRHWKKNKPEHFEAYSM